MMEKLSKRLEDESTQQRICNFLQNASSPQLQQLASMAGVPLAEAQADKLVSICHGVTPKRLRRTIAGGKRVLYVGKLVRKLMQFTAKYRNVLIWIVLLSWTKSALRRPLPLNRVNRRAAKAAAKAAKAAAKAAGQTA